MYNAELLERLLRRILPYYFVLILLLTTCGILLNYYQHNLWAMGDWLINYSGGFVRRGLTGEFSIILSKITSLNPGVFVALLMFAFYSIYFYFSYRLLDRINLLPYAMLIFSTFIFTFQLSDFNAGYRKEIIYFATMSFLGYAKVKYDRKAFERIFFIILFFYGFVVLSHEMLAIFTPYIIAIYTINQEISVKKWLLIFVCSIPTLISLLLTTYYNGTEEKVSIILETLSHLNYEMSNGGAMEALTKEISDEFYRVLERIGSYISLYSITFLLSLIAFIPLRYKIKHLFQDRRKIHIVSISVFGTLILCAFAIDWGRFLNIHLVSILLLLLVSEKMSRSTVKLQELRRVSTRVVVLIAVWLSLYSIPHCCETIESHFKMGIKQIAPVSYLAGAYGIYKEFYDR